ncbi:MULTISPECIES: hypothetical protein [Pseudofrankia]|uniref:hypothetical protein n=1 Tax=Pseudofrankia TaxID=2994363 RepID=UPI000234B3BC|nr:MULTISPECIES: hypothetical protein [Pseudofrankia]OHV29864.1 hypothetical protein BCD49_35495 [Pseudofrankia sp. EUN1h]
MRLTRIAGECPDGRTCPTAYATDRGTVVIQGYRLDAGTLARVPLGADETAVEVPLSLLEEVTRCSTPSSSASTSTPA